MKEKILFVDDDETILPSFKRYLGLEFNVDTALGGALGLEIIKEQGPYAVIVSDMRMPGMDGTRFLCQVRKQWPDSVRILLTGQADMNDAVDVVNEGYIFRFLTKPCPPEKISLALNDGLKQYRLIKSEKELLHKTLKGIIKLLIDMMSTVNPAAFSRSMRVRNMAGKIGARLTLEDLWQVEIAALLSQIGCLTIPPDILKKKYQGESLSASENSLFTKRLQIGRELLTNIPRLQEVAEGVAYQEKKFDGEGLPRDSIKGKDIPLIARILIVVHHYDDLVMSGKSQMGAVEEMHRHRTWYDPDILAALKAEIMQAKEGFVVREISPDEIEIGMVLAADVKTRTNLLLVAKHQEISSSLRICIMNFAQKKNITDPIKILDLVEEKGNVN